MADQYVRKTGVAIIDSKDTLLCIGHDGVAVRFDGDSAGLVAVALEILHAPSSADDLQAELTRRAGAPIDPALVTGLLGALMRARIVATSIPARQKKTSRALEGVRVVLALTGAVAAAEAPRTVLGLQRRGATVRVVMSRAAGRFVSRWTLQALTHEKVHAKMMSSDPHTPAPHIELGRWADAVLVAPTTATTLSRIARGDNSDLVSALCIASSAPVLLSPSMNVRMLEAPSTQRNLEVLRSDGFYLLRPSSGIEVADEPEARQQKGGAALDAEVLVSAFEGWYQHVVRPENARTEIDWDALYRTTKAEDLPWMTQGIEESLRSLLLEFMPPPGTLLDVGCGLGFQSRALSALGYLTIGSDLSKEAISRAAMLAPQKGCLFMQDDIRDSKIGGCFDIVLDRGTFHSMPQAARVRYEKSIRRVTAPGSILVIIHDGPEADARFATARMTSEDVERMFQGFRLVATRPAMLRRGEGDKACCTVLKRVE